MTTLLRARGTFHYLDPRSKQFPVWLTTKLEEIHDQGGISHIIQLSDGDLPTRYPIADKIIEECIKSNIFGGDTDEEKERAIIDFYDPLLQMVKDLHLVCQIVVEYGLRRLKQPIS